MRGRHRFTHETRRVGVIFAAAGGLEVVAFLGDLQLPRPLARGGLEFLFRVLPDGELALFYGYSLEDVEFILVIDLQD